MKAYVIHENENYWRGFIYDKDSCSAVVRKYFRGGTLTKCDHDPETVDEARDEAKTVITSNADHYITFTRKAQRRSDNKDCEDCWGLVIIPNLDLQRDYAFRKANLRAGITVRGMRLPWKAVLWANLCVRITSDGKVQVSRFERCEYCQRDLPINAAWYRGLPSLG